MTPALTLAPASPLHGLLITFMAHRFRLLLVPLLILIVAVVTAAVIPVRYAIESQVLVALGPEYTFRPPAGEPASVSQGMDRDQSLHTEASILGSQDLHRATLRAIGVGRLYPRILHPNLFEQAINTVKERIDALARAAGLVEGERPPAPDPVELALKQFESALASELPKTGSVIAETFRHKDAALGAETLNKMLALYVERRAELYRDDQSAIVGEQVDIARAAWTNAEARLAAFKRAHQVSAFDAQREMLLRRRSTLENDRADAESDVAQLRARLDTLAAQMADVQPDIAASRETDIESRAAPIRASIEQLQAQYTKALEQYQPDAPQLQTLRGQLAARRTDLAEARRDRSASSVRTTQNSAWLALQDDRIKSRTNLAVATTRLAQDDLHLQELAGTIANLDAGERELSELQLQRALTEETYRNATKTLQDRRITDAVEASRRPTVRILQPATPPVSAPPLRILVLAAGGVLAVFGLAAATLLAHAFGRTYWQAEMLEQDLGIAVLATFPDLSRRRRAALAWAE